MAEIDAVDPTSSRSSRRCCCPRSGSAAGVGPDEDTFRAAVGRAAIPRSSRAPPHEDRFLRRGREDGSGRRGAYRGAAGTRCARSRSTTRPTRAAATPRSTSRRPTRHRRTSAPRSSRASRASSARRAGIRPSSARSPRRKALRLFVAPNFSIGAVLMMRFAREAAEHFPRAEIIELHNEAKKDAPSGTAKATAELWAATRRSIPSVCPARRAPGSDLRRRGPAADDPPRHDGPRVVRRRCLLALLEARRAAARLDVRPRRTPLETDARSDLERARG